MDCNNLFFNSRANLPFGEDFLANRQEMDSKDDAIQRNPMSVSANGSMDLSNSQDHVVQEIASEAMRESADDEMDLAASRSAILNRVDSFIFDQAAQDFKRSLPKPMNLKLDHNDPLYQELKPINSRSKRYMDFTDLSRDIRDEWTKVDQQFQKTLRLIQEGKRDSSILGDWSSQNKELVSPVIHEILSIDGSQGVRLKEICRNYKEAFHTFQKTASIEALANLKEAVKELNSYAYVTTHMERKLSRQFAFLNHLEAYTDPTEGGYSIRLKAAEKYFTKEPLAINRQGQHDLVRSHVMLTANYDIQTGFFAKTNPDDSLQPQSNKAVILNQNEDNELYQLTHFLNATDIMPKTVEAVVTDVEKTVRPILEQGYPEVLNGRKTVEQLMSEVYKASISSLNGLQNSYEAGSDKAHATEMLANGAMLWKRQIQSV